MLPGQPMASRYPPTAVCAPIALSFGRVTAHPVPSPRADNTPRGLAVAQTTPSPPDEGAQGSAVGAGIWGTSGGTGLGEAAGLNSALLRR